MDIEIGEVGSAGLLPESLLVDLPEIDAQHEEIFNRIESLKSACFESAITPIDEFESLLAYFAFHFATEERLADAVGLGLRPGLAARTQRDGDVEAGILQVHRLCAALAAIAEDHDPLALQSVRLHILVRIQFGHCGASGRG